MSIMYATMKMIIISGLFEIVEIINLMITIRFVNISTVIATASLDNNIYTPRLCNVRNQSWGL